MDWMRCLTVNIDDYILEYMLMQIKISRLNIGITKMLRLNGGIKFLFVTVIMFYQIILNLIFVL